MTADQRLTIILTAFAVLFVPAITVLIRATIKWTRVESRLDEIANDLVALIKDKDQAHIEILTAMREDRQATDKRLRWLEEHLWNQGKG